MSASKACVTCFAIVSAALVVVLVHYNHTVYLEHVACLDAGGNWGSNQYGDAGGCKAARK